MEIKELENMYEELKDLYLNQNLTTTEIAKKIGVNRYQVIRLFKKYDIIKSNGDGRRKYYLNTHYFDKIDTPNKAYVLGFLYADGYNNPKTNSIVLTLSEKDEDILEKIRLEIGCGKPLYRIKSGKKNNGEPKIFKSLILSSKYMCEKIKELGIYPNKTFIITFPNFLSPELMRHFIRGYFDGDGCVSITHEKKRTRISFNLMSSTPFCLDMKEYFKTIGIKVNVNHPSGKKYENSLLRTSSKKEILKIMHYLYDGADLYMKRKYQKFKEFFEE